MPEAIKAVRGDTFVVETNIHYPTESSLIGDGLRKVVTLAAELAKRQRTGGLASARALAQDCVEQARDIGRLSRAKGKGPSVCKRGIRNCWTWPRDC